MEPVIREENTIYAIGCSYEADWTNLCRTTERAAYWSEIDFSGMDKSAYAGIENKCGEEIAFWLCRETGEYEMEFFFGERVHTVGNVPEGMEVLEIPSAKYAIFTLDKSGENVSQADYVNEIKELWRYIIEEWLPVSGYGYNEDKCNFEVYSGTRMQVYIPIC